MDNATVDFTNFFFWIRKKKLVWLAPSLYSYIFISIERRKYILYKKLLQLDMNWIITSFKKNTNGVNFFCQCEWWAGFITFHFWIYVYLISYVVNLIIKLIYDENFKSYVESASHINFMNNQMICAAIFCYNCILKIREENYRQFNSEINFIFMAN